MHLLYVCVCVLKTKNVCSKYYVEFLLHKLTLKHLVFIQMHNW